MDNETRIRSFDELEKAIYDHYMAECRKVYAELLKEMDDWIFEHRDQALFKIKTNKEMTRKCIFGDVRYNRRYYGFRAMNGEEELVFLLDDAFNQEKIGLFSVGIAEEVARMFDEKMSGMEVSKELAERHHLEVSRQATYLISNAYHEYMTKKAKESLQA